MFAEVPPRVEYEMTRKARGLGPAMEALTVWWNEYGKSVPAKRTMRGRKSRGRKSTWSRLEAAVDVTRSQDGWGVQLASVPLRAPMLP